MVALFTERAGTATTVPASAFPYAFDSAFTALRCKRKKDPWDHRNRFNSDNLKRLLSKSKEDEAYRDSIRRCFLDWRDIDVSLDDFPYFLKFRHLPREVSRGVGTAFAIQPSCV